MHVLHKYKAVAPNDSDLASAIRDQARSPSALSDNEEHQDAPRIARGEIDKTDFQNYAVNELGLEDHQVEEIDVQEPAVPPAWALEKTTELSRGLILLVANAFIIILIVSFCVMFAFKQPTVSIGESCLYNSDCNSYAGLKCTMGTCSCSTVQYWNGLQCVPQRTYNRSCSSQSQCNSLAYLLCMNITTGLYTDSLCWCSSFRYWSGNQCSNLKTWNDTCTTSLECDINNYLTCINGRCDCNSTQFWNNQYCKNKLTYGSQCFSTYWCNSASSGLVCSTWDPTDGTCDCSSNQYWWWTTQTCLDQLPINSTCSFDYQCLTNLSLSCSSTTSPSSCQCSDRYFYNTTKCTPKFLYGSPCTSSLQCDSTLLLICNSTAQVCTCNESSYTWDDANYDVRRTIGGSCTSDAQFLSYQNLTCPTTGIWNGTCGCPTNFYWNTATSSCALKKLWNQTCATSYECYDGEYLSCQPSTTLNTTVCDCANYTYYWTGFLNNTYSGYCTPKINYNVTSFTCVNSYQCRDYDYVTCVSGLCTCSYDRYWDGTFCEPRLNYSYPCNSTSMCRNWPSGPNLQCLVPYGGSIEQCVCNSSQYFDYCADYCYSVKGWQQICNSSSCSAPSMCDQTKALSCINGVCNCSITQWWNSTTCLNKGCVSSQCVCGSGFYWSPGSNYCLAKSSYLGTCTSTLQCDTVGGTGLSCQSGQCKCSGSATWNSGAGICT